MKYLAISLVALAVGLAAFFIFDQKNDGLTITLTEDGFRPSELEIKLGDTVTFRNQTDMMFWPAADIHPYHAEYPAFDPKGPLPIGGEWSFTFDRLGKWSFHDHISPNYTGVVYVRSADGQSGGACFDVGNSDCWVNLIATALEAGGVDAAYLELKRIHDSNDKFAGDCHTYGHDIGLKAYKLYGADVELTEKTSWCNAGFYHGFMEGFVEDETDPEKIDAFCTHVGEVVGGQFGLAEGHCRHGIGHGSLEKLLFDNQLLNEEPIDVVNKAMDLCYATSNDDENMLLRCTSGVYDTFRNWLYDTHAPPSQDLVESALDFCVPYEEWYIKRACYLEMPKILTYIPNPDYTINVFDFKSEVHPDDWEEYGPLVVRAFTARFGKQGVMEKTLEEMIGFCRTDDPELQNACLLGMFDGIQFAGTPGEEYKVSSAFCGHELLNDTEKASCFHDFQEEVFYTYSSDQWPEMCKLIPEEFVNPGRVCRLDAIN